MRVLVFGDSITQGFWDADGGWVNALRRYYDLRAIEDLDKDEVTIINLGISGDTSKKIKARIKAEVKARMVDEPLVVVIQIGINDSYHFESAPNVTLAEYQQNLDDIIELIKPLSTKIIFVGISACLEGQTTPVSWRDINYTNKDIKQYEDTMAKVAAEHDLPFIPVFDQFQAELAKNPRLLADGLHPTHQGHQVMLDIIKPKLTEILNKT